MHERSVRIPTLTIILTVGPDRVKTLEINLLVNVVIKVIFLVYFLYLGLLNQEVMGMFKHFICRLSHFGIAYFSCLK